MCRHLYFYFLIGYVLGMSPSSILFTIAQILLKWTWLSAFSDKAVAWSNSKNCSKSHSEWKAEPGFHPEAEGPKISHLHPAWAPIYKDSWLNCWTARPRGSGDNCRESSRLSGVSVMRGLPPTLWIRQGVLNCGPPWKPLAENSIPFSATEDI